MCLVLRPLQRWLQYGTFQIPCQNAQPLNKHNWCFFKDETNQDVNVTSEEEWCAVHPFNVGEGVIISLKFQSIK